MTFLNCVPLITPKQFQIQNILLQIKQLQLHIQQLYTITNMVSQ